MKNGKDIAKMNNGLIDVESSVITKHSEVSQLDTPNYYVKQQQGFDYVDEGYMRHLLNLHYPIWGWEIIKYEFIGDKSIAVHGRLTIADNGIERSFDSIDAHRIASNEKGYVDIGNDLKSANTDCFKVAVNRLCNIADDVYRKRIEDITLSTEQVATITGKLKAIKDKANVVRIKAGMEKMTINSTNYDATMRRIETLIGE